MVKKERSRWSDEPHLVIYIDGHTFDGMLAKILKNDDLHGLVPSISWLQDERERNYTIQKIFSLKVTKEIIPVLVCPDDEDLSCTVIVAEVRIEDDVVFWSRLGLDESPNEFPQTIGNKVSWFKGLPVYQFDIKQYKESWIQIKSEEY